MYGITLDNHKGNNCHRCLFLVDVDNLDIDLNFDNQMSLRDNFGIAITVIVMNICFYSTVNFLKEFWHENHKEPYN